MGEIKRKRKKFSKPRKLFDRERIDYENVIVKEFGLKNKREIWKMNSKVSKFRRRAKELINDEKEEQKLFFDKLNKLGLNVKEISDILGLTERDLLERRLQTIVFKKNLANSVKQARQLIVHKHILVDGSIINKPSFWVEKDLENKIKLRPRKEKTKVEAKPVEIETKTEEVEE